MEDDRGEGGGGGGAKKGGIGVNVREGGVGIEIKEGEILRTLGGVELVHRPPPPPPVHCVSSTTSHSQLFVCCHNRSIKLRLQDRLQLLPLQRSSH